MRMLLLTPKFENRAPNLKMPARAPNGKSSDNTQSGDCFLHSAIGPRYQKDLVEYKTNGWHRVCEVGRAR